MYKSAVFKNKKKTASSWRMYILEEIKVTSSGVHIKITTLSRWYI